VSKKVHGILPKEDTFTHFKIAEVVINLKGKWISFGKKGLMDTTP
jgi:hypothetical protein